MPLKYREIVKTMSKPQHWYWINWQNKNMVHARTLARLASLAVRHVVKDVLHGTTVGQVTLPYLPVGLLSPLALVGVEQKHQLLLYEFALFRVGRWRHTAYCSRRHRRGSRSRPESTLGVGQHAGCSCDPGCACRGRLRCLSRDVTVNIE